MEVAGQNLSPLLSAQFPRSREWPLNRGMTVFLSVTLSAATYVMYATLIRSPSFYCDRKYFVQVSITKDNHRVTICQAKREFLCIK